MLWHTSLESSLRPSRNELRMRMVKTLSDFMYVRFVEQYGERYTVERLLADKTVFKNFKMCRFATSVAFQQIFRPGGTLEELKKYYSGKQKLYGFKVEVSVLPNGLAMFASKHHPGSVSDTEIMREMLVFHDEALEKTVSEKSITDIGFLGDKYGDYWGVLCDKGYAGIEADVRAIVPKTWRYIEFVRATKNEVKESDRVFVENVFARQRDLWAIVANKYRWSEESYDDFFA